MPRDGRRVVRGTLILPRLARSTSELELDVVHHAVERPPEPCLQVLFQLHSSLPLLVCRGLRVPNRLTELVYLVLQKVTERHEIKAK